MKKQTNATPELTLLLWGGLLNGIWEFAHSSLFTDHVNGWYYVVWSRLHCTVGDLMILLACFWITAVIFRSRRWASGNQFALPGVVFIAMGLSYTLFSEWLNTQVRGSWTYADAMPTLFGFGLSPLLQWLIVPVILIRIFRIRSARILLDQATIESRQGKN